MKWVAALAIAVLVALPARAETGTDYICLKACLGTNAPYSVCQPKCSYDTSSSGEALALHTSYTCLRDCVNGTAVNNGTSGVVISSGAPVAVCLPACTEDPAQLMARVKPTHNQFTAPKPIDNGEIVLPDKVSKPVQQPQSMDYGCLGICTKGGLRYPLCEQRCERRDGDKIVLP